jgi:hypothetical protein
MGAGSEPARLVGCGRQKTARIVRAPLVKQGSLTDFDRCCRHWPVNTLSSRGCLMAFLTQAAPVAAPQTL